MLIIKNIHEKLDLICNTLPGFEFFETELHDVILASLSLKRSVLFLRASQSQKLPLIKNWENFNSTREYIFIPSRIKAKMKHSPRLTLENLNEWSEILS